MTREQVIEAFTMRVDGETYQAIAAKFGLTREAVCQKLQRVVAGHKAIERRCVYPGLVKWMREHNMNASELNRQAGICKGAQAFYNRLYGHTGWGMDEIKKILNFTNMTFMEAFGTKLNPDELPGDY